MTVQEEKRWLRRRLRTLEDQLSSRYLASSGRAIIAHLLAMPEYQAAETVFCFVGVGREVDIRSLDPPVRNANISPNTGEFPVKIRLAKPAPFP